LKVEEAEREYLGIQAALDNLQSRLVRHQVENEAKQERAEELKELLKEASIDVDDLDGEKARIEGEMEGIIAEGTRKIQEFSDSLQGDDEEPEELEPITEEPATHSDGLDLD